MEALKTWTVVDYILVGTLLVAFFLGWTRGIIRFLTGFLSFLMATTLAGHYSQVVVTWINETSNLQRWIAGALLRRLSLPQEATRVPQAPVSFETASLWLKLVPLPQTYKQQLAQQLADWSVAAGGKSAAQFLVEQIAGGVMSALVFTLLVVLLTLLIGYLGRFVADVVHAIPLVGLADRLLGAAALTFEATLILCFVIIWLVPTLSMYGVRELGDAFGQSVLAPSFVQFFEWIRGLLFGGGTRLWNA